MASIHFATLSIRIRRPEISTTHWNNYRKPISCSCSCSCSSSSSSFDVLKSKKKSITISHAVNPTDSSSLSSSSSSSSENPEIELEFIGPKAGDAVEKASAISGDKLLRTIMEDNKIELYATYGKLMNCGGGGSCGTCIVEIIDGSELLNERTNTELKYLKKKPESWRLACQTIVGNKENSGKVVVQRLPQWKK